jgi:hypothetical protein
MHTIELTDDELRVLRSALASYLQAFGHNEAELLRAAKTLLLQLPEPTPIAS